jgi:uncharacterized lipoprotein YehR (DUF1307 family)
VEIDKETREERKKCKEIIDETFKTLEGVAFFWGWRDERITHYLNSQSEKIDPLLNKINSQTSTTKNRNKIVPITQEELDWGYIKFQVRYHQNYWGMKLLSERERPPSKLDNFFSKVREYFL